MRTAIAVSTVLLLAFVCTLPAPADSFTATGSGTGQAVLRFSTVNVTADVQGAVAFHGSVDIAGNLVGFSASGRVYGVGRVDLASLDLTAWLVVDASGETSVGESLTLRGGLTITEIQGSGTAGTGIGQFDLAFATPTVHSRARGTAEGSASGRFVVPEIEFTMQVDGTASFELDGVTFDPADGHSPPGGEDPLEISSWPDDLATFLRDALAESLVEEAI